VAALRRVRLGEGVTGIIAQRSVKELLEDGFGLIDLEFGFEVREVVVGEAVRAATGVGEVEVLIDHFLADASPVTLSASVLLDLPGVGINVAAFGEEARQVFCCGSGALAKALVVTVIELMRTSHFD